MTLKYEVVLGWKLLCSACVTQLHFPTHTKMSAANSSYQTMISFSRQIMFCSQISTQLEEISNNYLTAWSKLNGVSNLRSCHVLQFVVLSPISISMKAAFVSKRFLFSFLFFFFPFFTRSWCILCVPNQCLVFHPYRFLPSAFSLSFLLCPPPSINPSLPIPLHMLPHPVSSLVPSTWSESQQCG